MGPEAALIERAYAAGGITLAVCVALAIVVVVLWRRGVTRDKEIEQFRLAEVLQAKADLQVTQQKLDGCLAARLTDRDASTATYIKELHGQRDALEAAAGSGREQAEALDALAKTIGELRAELREHGKSIAELRIVKGGGR